MVRTSYQDKMRLETKWSEKWTWLISSLPRIALEFPLWESGELTIIRRRHWANGSRPESRTQPSRITTLRATDIPASTGAASPNRTGNRRFVASCDIHFTIAAGMVCASRTRSYRFGVCGTIHIYQDRWLPGLELNQDHQFQRLGYKPLYHLASNVYAN